MAHFAEIDEKNIVKRVIVINNEELMIDGVESELKGINFCSSIFGGSWVQTSYNSNFRKNFAVPGSKWDSELNIFILPQPYNSWILNIETNDWEAPVAYPTDGKYYYWDENTTTWMEPIV